MIKQHHQMMMETKGTLRWDVATSQLGPLEKLESTQSQIEDCEAQEMRIHQRKQEPSILSLIFPIRSGIGIERSQGIRREYPGKPWSFDESSMYGGRMEIKSGFVAQRCSANAIR
jgi:hypothetical protein